MPKINFLWWMQLAAVENQDMKVESVMGNYLCLVLAFEEG